MRALTTSPIEITPIILLASITGMWRKRPSVIFSSTEIAVSSGWQPITSAVIRSCTCSVEDRDALGAERAHDVALRQDAVDDRRRRG